jgi:hypothetical protein
VPYALGVRKRWFSRRAIQLHGEFFLLAAGCLVAGWWQVTRALTGNSLSWVYSAEWPGFALLAVLAWWHLIHEDPEARRARKQRTAEWDDDEWDDDDEWPESAVSTYGAASSDPVPVNDPVPFNDPTSVNDDGRAGCGS